MEAILKKDISQMTLEELNKAAKYYGVNDDSKIDTVQIDGLVSAHNILLTPIAIRGKKKKRCANFRN